MIGSTTQGVILQGILSDDVLNRQSGNDRIYGYEGHDRITAADNSSNDDDANDAFVDTMDAATAVDVAVDSADIDNWDMWSDGIAVVLDFQVGADLLQLAIDDFVISNEDSIEGKVLPCDLPVQQLDSTQGVLPCDLPVKQLDAGQGVVLPCDLPVKQLEVGLSELPCDLPVKQLDVGLGKVLPCDLPVKQLDVGLGEALPCGLPSGPSVGLGKILPCDLPVKQLDVGLGEALPCGLSSGGRDNAVSFGDMAFATPVQAALGQIDQVTQQAV